MPILFMDPDTTQIETVIPLEIPVASIPRGKIILSLCEKRNWFQKRLRNRKSFCIVQETWENQDGQLPDSLSLQQTPRKEGVYTFRIRSADHKSSSSTFKSFVKDVRLLYSTCVSRATSSTMSTIAGNRIRDVQARVEPTQAGIALQIQESFGTTSRKPTTFAVELRDARTDQPCLVISLGDFDDKRRSALDLAWPNHEEPVYLNIYAYRSFWHRLINKRMLLYRVGIIGRLVSINVTSSSLRS